MEYPKTFSDMPLNPELQKAILARGYELPTEIQKKAIPVLAVEDVDFLGQAQTGTGKTAAFVLPLLNRINPEIKSIQAIILTPTRELANQVCLEMSKFCPGTDYRSLAVYGGVSIEGQIRDLKRLRPQVIVATPGRALDLIARKALKLQEAKVAVLDEADVMLDMGFMDDVKAILDELDATRKIWLFSATMPPMIRKLVDQYLDNPMTVKVQGKALSAEGIDQKFFLVDPKHTLEALCRLLMAENDFFGIVFCRMKIDAKEISDALNDRGIAADALHGDLSQQQRDLAMKRFKEKKAKILVCTDVAARGIDVDNLTHVVNFGLPQDLESYVHRIGRTGRAGASGIAWSLVGPKDAFKIRQIENLVKAKISKGVIPSASVLRTKLVEKDFSRFIERESKILSQSEKVSNADEFSVFKKHFEGKDFDLSLRILFDEIYEERLEQFKKGGPLDELGAKEARKMTEHKGGWARLFLNMGKDQGLGLRSLLAAASSHLEVDERLIKRVDIKGSFSFMEVPESAAMRAISVRDFKIAGKSVHYELSEGAGPSRSSQERGSGRFSQDSGGMRRKSFRRS